MLPAQTGAHTATHCIIIIIIIVVIIIIIAAIPPTKFIVCLNIPFPPLIKWENGFLRLRLWASSLATLWPRSDAHALVSGAHCACAGVGVCRPPLLGAGAVLTLEGQPAQPRNHSTEPHPPTPDVLSCLSCPFMNTANHRHRHRLRCRLVVPAIRLSFCWVVCQSGSQSFLKFPFSHPSFNYLFPLRVQPSGLCPGGTSRKVGHLGVATPSPPPN